MTLRDNTERPETIELGTNELLGINPKAIGPSMDKLFLGKWKGKAPKLGMVKQLAELCSIYSYLIKIEKSNSIHKNNYKLVFLMLCLSFYTVYIQIPFWSF